MQKIQIITAALIVSLVANVALLAGTSDGKPKDDPRAAAAALARRQVDNVLQGMPEERRNALRTGLRQEQAALQAAHQKVREGRQALNQLIKTETLDMAAVQDQQAKVRDAFTETIDAEHRLVASILPKLSHEERELLYKRPPRPAQPPQAQPPGKQAPGAQKPGDQKPVEQKPGARVPAQPPQATGSAGDSKNPPKPAAPSQ